MSIEAELNEILTGESGLDDNEGFAFEQPQGPYDAALFGETSDLYNQESPWDGSGSTLSESEATDLAHQLMNVTSEAEMEEFFGNLWKKVKSGLKTVGQAAMPIAANFIKNQGASLLKKALPLVGSAVGSIVPGAGTVIGGALGGALSQLISGEVSYNNDYEAKLDLSKRLVQAVTNAAVQAAKDPGAAFDAVGAVKTALTQQVQSNLTPEMRRALAGSRAAGVRAAGGRAMQGRWERRGNQIVILGA